MDNVPDDVSAAQVIAANLGQIGIKVNVEPIDPAVISDLPGPGGGGAHPQLLYYYYGGESDPNLWFEWWTCAQMGLWNWDHWCNPEFTKLTNEALATYDVAKRTSSTSRRRSCGTRRPAWSGSATRTTSSVAQPYVKPSFLAQGGLLIWNTTAT